MMSLVADITPRDRLGRAYSLYTSAVYAGMTFGPAAGGLVGRTWGLAESFLVSGGLVFSAALFSFFSLPRSEPYRHPRGESTSVRASLAALLGNHRLESCLLGTIGGCFGFGMFVSFLPLHARALGLDPGQIGLVFATQALANAFLRIPFGRLSDRIDRGAMASAGLLLFALALSAIGLCRGFWALTVCAGLLGTGMGFGFTALGALVADVVSREQRGFALGMYNSCIYLGMMLSSATMGYVIHRVGFRNGFITAGALVAGMTLLFYFRYRAAVTG
jgi:MFS family permease